MKTISKLKLSSSEKQALVALKRRLSDEMQGIKVILYGSKARGDSIPESDIDLLVLVEGDVTSVIKNRIRSIKYDIELTYDVILSLIIEDSKYWQSTQAQLIPLHSNIEKDGIAI
jgi:uncharacterized protein